MRAVLQAAPYLGFMFAQQIFDELLARITRNPFCVHETQGRRRNHRLLDRNVRVAHGDIQVTVGVSLVPERTVCEPRQAACMAIREWNGETIRGGVRKPMHAVARETEILSLFTVRHDRRTSGFKPLDGVSDCILKERSEVRIFIGILTAALSDSLD